MLTFVLIGLVLIGFLISLYFTLVYLDISVPVIDSVANFCRFDTRQCQKVIETESSHLFGVANFVLGLFYYTVLFLYLILPSSIAWIFFILVVMACWVVVILSLYLAFELRYVLKIPCRLCFTIHGMNVAIAVLILFV
ncbi:MAG: vitamin K epoxide reductase family protein [Deltaproteobacteria bacterium]|nr:vitamin K epoxide reductase family protein [Deltaproteobacteria bacterium]